MKLMKNLQVLLAVVAILFSTKITSAQTNNNYIRIATITVDSLKLESYKAALKEEIETSVKVEAGVLALNAVYEKNQPTHVTILEIYQDMDAYKSHIQTPHFKKYKSMVEGMVKSLVLTDVLPIAMPVKVKK
jgi:quinol monooxygenase YgiN